MLGDSSTTQLQIHTTTTTSSQSVEGGRVGGGSNIGQHEEEARRGEGGGGGVDNISLEVGSERSFGGNRWPRQETLALLKIRSDMDVAFREASVKGPLWDEVSRKLAELGYNRSSKKCREKFENVYKYHKRTKEGRPGKSEGKTYRFFDQLEAFESQPSLLSPPPQPPPPQQVPTRVQTPVIIPATMPAGNINVSIPPGIGASNVTVPSVAPGPATLSFSIPSYQQGSKPTLQPPQQQQQQQQQQVQPIANVTDQPQTNIPSSNFQPLSPNLASNSSSSSTSSDVEIQGRGKKKRKWKDFFERLMREVIQKQEDMQRRFLEAIEKREQERMHREESWRMQEIARVTKEREILAQERSMAATKDAAMMAFLQKLSEQQNLGQLQVIAAPSQPPAPAPARPPPPPQPAPILAPQLLQQQQLAVAAVATTTSATATTPLATATTMTTTIVPTQQVAKSGELIFKSDNGDQNLMPPSSSRWPKVEVQALIKLRTSLDSKYQDNGPKGPLWEEISSGMRRLGYNRNAKRCKEKWENINKYFKKVKESNKQRPEDSKTCPYFHQLDALYKEKNKMFEGSSASNIQFRPENSVPLLVQPEQQWPPPPPGQQEHRPNDAVMEDIESEDDDDDDDVDDKDNEDEEEDEAGGYEIVANSKSKATPVSTGE